jgi:hypothetical protein
MTVLDEPFYGIWLKQNGKNQPFVDEIIQTMECNNTEKIHDDIEGKEKLKGNIFVKSMAIIQ